MEPGPGLTTALLSLLSGAIVGLSLGLVGGGGSILAVPLLIYLVGVGSTHIAIGTSAVAVAVNALISLVSHARSGNVKWNCGIVFALFGAAGAAMGSTLGKLTDGDLLLALFGGLMIAVAVLMFRRTAAREDPDVHLGWATVGHLLPRLGISGASVGALSGFFGIGGGFLIVPGLMKATAMPILYAIGTSLLAVFALGAATAANYAIGGFVNWQVAALFIAGGMLGGVAGAHLAGRLSTKRGLLQRVFATVVSVAGAWLLVSRIHEYI